MNTQRGICCLNILSLSQFFIFIQSCKEAHKVITDVAWCYSDWFPRKPYICRDDLLSLAVFPGNTKLYLIQTLELELKNCSILMPCWKLEYWNHLYGLTDTFWQMISIQEFLKMLIKLTSEIQIWIFIILKKTIRIWRCIPRKIFLHHLKDGIFFTTFFQHFFFIY